MAEMLQLTENSWIIRRDDDQDETLFKTDEGYRFKNPRSHSAYASLDAAERAFGISIRQAKDPVNYQPAG